MSDKKSTNAKLNKEITRAILPFFNKISDDGMSLIEAQSYLLESARSQLEFFQSIACGSSVNEEIQITAGSISGFCENLINQLNAMDAVNNSLSGQLHQSRKEQEADKKSIKNTGGGL